MRDDGWRGDSALSFWLECVAGYWLLTEKRTTGLDGKGG